MLAHVRSTTFYKLLQNISWCGDTIILAIPLLLDTWVVSQFFTLMDTPAMNTFSKTHLVGVSGG